MNAIRFISRKLGWLIGASAAVLVAGTSVAAPLAVPDLPLFLPDSVPPLNLLVLGRDHKLYYEAYNDYTDLNDDGQLDIGYKGYFPEGDARRIDYYGYFDSYKCYTHDGSKFNPVRMASSTKACGGTGEWSGDFLNYLTTSRIDALRKVLYGGYRSTDTSSATVLERSHIPQDAHSWGKEYRSISNDGYDIRQYSPYNAPTAGSCGSTSGVQNTCRHLFANTTPVNTSNPLLRVLQNRSERIWNWVSIERPVAGTQVVNASGSRTNVTPADIIVRVAVCVSGLFGNENCQQYPNGNYKPFGLLQEFGENDSMYFGLLSGSYAKNTSGGVLRRTIGSIRDEVSSTDGTFASYNGIIRTLNRLKATGFDVNGTSYQYTCAWNAANRTITEGECQMWGNPIAEMMYEGLRYFAGKGTPTSAFSTSFGQGEESQFSGGGIPVASWDNPFSNRAVCSKPFETVVSDINPSYDTDQLPGTAFGSFTSDVTGLNVSTLGQTIWNQEIGGSGQYFIGQSLADSTGYVGTPKPKTVNSFGNIRGLSPEEPTKNGGYYAGSVAYYGRTTDLNSASSDQKVSTFAVALASPLPKIEIPVNGKKITLVPFAKSVAGSGISASGSFQPTDQIVDFYVDTWTSTYGKFRVNFEDVEQGADHDMDAITVYEYTVSGSTVTVKLTSEYAQGGITQHMGYVISGTNGKDGIYLEVRDVDTNGSCGNGANCASGDNDYALDTPAAFTGVPPAPSSGTGKWNDGVALPLTATRTFSPGNSAGASLLNDPLWYAAKWGGFTEDEDTANNVPDQTQEWDENGDGDPDNYFLVTNALKLSQQLRSAFEDILRRTTSSSSASVNSGSISSETRVYQARFNTGEWTGELWSYPLDTKTGSVLLNDAETWEAGGRLPDPNSRDIITRNSNNAAVPFRWANLDSTRQAQLDSNATTAESLLNYLRGDDSNEGTATGEFRERRTKLGDIVSSSPLFVGSPRFRYRDSLESIAYSSFVEEQKDRLGMVYAGANDGMLHGFDAKTGIEVFSYIPSPVFANLKNLASQNYSHQFFVDGPPSTGDVFFNNAWHTVVVGGLNKGGQGIYALDVTNPSTLANAESNAASIALWEFTDRDDAAKAGIQGDADLGLTYSQPSIVRLHDGRWAAVFGNGYNNTTSDGSTSSSGDAVLYIVDIETGNLIKKISTETGTNEDPGINRPNGLATPSLVDLDGDRIVDYAYAGDLYGNLWKFNLTSSTSTEWDVLRDTSNAPLPLYKARDASGNAQPITGRPEVARGPYGAGMMVLFGTGKYLEPDDKKLDPERIQAFYGIVDRNTGTEADRVSGLSELTQQTILAETNFKYDSDGDGDIDGDDSSTAVRVTSNNPLGSNRGWYINLLSPVSGYQAEKQVSNPIVRNGRVIFTTLIPDKDPCEFGGSSWLMELDLLDGSRLEDSPFDLNRDGEFSNADFITITLSDGTEITVAVSGLGSEEGILQAPGVVDGNEGVPVQYKYLPGSSGNIQRVTENPGEGGAGRQSWRQVR